MEKLLFNHWLFLKTYWREEIMRDLSKQGFDTRSPLRNYIRLLEQIENVNDRFKRLEQLVLDLAVEMHQEKR